MKDTKSKKSVKKAKSKIVKKPISQSKKKGSNKNNKNVKNIVFVPIIIAIVILMILSMKIFDTRTLTCTKNSRDGMVISENKVILKLNNDDIKNIKVTKNFTVESKGDVDYISSVKTALDSIYKDLDVKYKVTKRNNSSFLEVTYDKKKEYIIDNVSVVMENDGISINLISEDNGNNYAKIDLSKKHTMDDLKTIFKKAKYTCK